MSGQGIIVTKNEKEVGRFIPKKIAVSYLANSITEIYFGKFQCTIFNDIELDIIY